MCPVRSLLRSRGLHRTSSSFFFPEGSHLKRAEQGTSKWTSYVLYCSPDLSFPLSSYNCVCEPPYESCLHKNLCRPLPSDPNFTFQISPIIVCLQDSSLRKGRRPTPNGNATPSSTVMTITSPVICTPVIFFTIEREASHFQMEVPRPPLPS